jgi:uncharacterized protein (DUF488 family)
MDRPILFTVGHSNHSPGHFLDLLREHAVEVLADVRSAPYSRYASQFNHGAVRELVTGAGVRYLFLGKELGGRPEGREFYDEEDRVDYSRVAGAEFFQRGLAQVERAIEGARVAIMCSEECPAGCHRHLLIARVLAERGVEIRNIRGDGRVQTYAEVDADALGSSGQLDLFPAAEQAWKSVRPVPLLTKRDRSP